jgi:hypothetical protein
VVEASVLPPTVLVPVLVLALALVLASVLVVGLGDGFPPP